MNTKAMFSSKKQDWETPQELFDLLDDEFSFDLDAAAQCTNTKCLHYFTEADDALGREWKGTVWLNPPYGKELGKWVKHAFEEALQGHIIVCLLPARTDTEYFHRYIMRADEIRFIQGRLKFVGAKNAAPFPSMIVVFRGGRNVQTRKTPAISTLCLHR